MNAFDNTLLEKFIKEMPNVGMCNVDYTEGVMIISANDFFYESLGYDQYSFEQTSGNQFMNILSDSDRFMTALILNEMISSEEKCCEFNVNVRKKDGTLKNLRLFFTYYKESGNIGYMMTTDISTLKILEDKYNSLEDRMQILMSITKNIVMEYDFKTKIIHWWNRNDTIDRNDTTENVPDNLFRSELVDSAYKNEIISMFSQIHNGAQSASCVAKSRFNDGLLWYRWDLHRVNIEGENKAVGLITEINAQMEAQMEAASVEQSRVLMLRDTTCYFSANISKDKVESFVSHLEERPMNVDGYTFTEVQRMMLENVMPDYRDQYLQTFCRENLLVYDSAKYGELSFEYLNQFADSPGSEIVWERITANVYVDKTTQDVKANIYVKNINEYKKKQEELIKKSQHDALTGLLNKAHTEINIKNILEADPFESECHAYFMIDLDNFKGINDNYGHLIGDEVLKKASAKISEIFRPTDIRGRVGGDEFAVFMRDVGTPENAMVKANDLCRNFSSAFKAQYGVTCSVGISVYPMHGKTLKELYTNADSALYYSKRSGKNAYTLYGTENAVSPDRQQEDKAPTSRRCSCESEKPVIENISIDESLKKELVFLSTHDSITGLCNRNAYNKYLETLDEKDVQSLGVIICDINSLKQFNRKYGTAYGNDIVKKLAESLSMYFANYNVFHMGGDDFCIIAENTTLEALRILVDEFKENIRTNYEFTVSMGLAWKDDSPQFYDLFELANERHDSDKIISYTLENSMSDSVLKAKTEALQKELAENKYIIHLQPKVDAITKACVGAEALARKIDKDGSIIPPARFIPGLEADGLIRMLDLFVLRKVFELQQRWMIENRKPMRISINASRLTVMDPLFVPLLKKVAEEEFPLVPRHLIAIEITESVGDVSFESIKEISRKVKALGFVLSLDDFGSNYTNMSTIMGMDFDELKLDRNIVSSFADSKNGPLILGGLIRLCQGLNISVVAEGVENDNQLKNIKALGVDIIQGFYFSRPLNIDDFETIWYRHK